MKIEINYEILENMLYHLFYFVLIPLTLYGQEDVEQLQKLDKLMFSGRYFESKELYKNIRDNDVPF